MSEPDLVTVVIPAYNAAATIDETLRSVRSQTHLRLEILVIDDGSEDSTPQIVLRHAAEDQRIRLIQQPNGGVASARNRGIAAATGEFVAPIDADDLWRPDKIERQLAALHHGGDDVALVYSWSADVDSDGRIVGVPPGSRHSGVVLDSIVWGNFIGNGSSALMRKKAVIEAGGYDPSLRARSAQGCEDYQLYFRIATKHKFAVVPDHLTGYRRSANRMSADLVQMLRSEQFVLDEMCTRYPERASEIRERTWLFLFFSYQRALTARCPGAALRIAALFIRQRPFVGTMKVFFTSARSLARWIALRLWPAWYRKTPLPAGRRFIAELPLSSPTCNGELHPCRR